MGQSSINILVMKYGSKYGSYNAVIICFILLLLFNLNLAFLFILSIIFSYVITSVIRIVYFKERPEKIKYSSFLMKIRASSFPSAHVQRATIITYFLSILWIYSLFITIILTLLVGYTRYKKKRHDLYDISAGYCLAFIIIIILKTLVF